MVEKKYIVKLNGDEILKILEYSHSFEVIGVDYFGDDLFGSEGAEIQYFKNLHKAMMEERIGPIEYSAKRAEFYLRLKQFYRDYFDEFSKQRRLGISLAMGGLMGILSVLYEKYRYEKPSNIRYLLASGLAVAASYLAQQYIHKRSTTEVYKIKPEDAIFTG